MRIATFIILGIFVFQAVIPQTAGGNTYLRPLSFAEKQGAREHPLGPNSKIAPDLESLKATLNTVIEWFKQQGYPDVQFLELYQVEPVAKVLFNGSMSFIGHG